MTQLRHSDRQLEELHHAAQWPMIDLEDLHDEQLVPRRCAGRRVRRRRVRPRRRLGSGRVAPACLG